MVSKRPANPAVLVKSESPSLLLGSLQKTEKIVR